MRFPVKYTTFSTPATANQPPRIIARRPIVPVVLTNGTRSWPIYAIIDSGADTTMFPTFVATLLGLPTGKGQLETFDGAGSVNQSAWYFTDIELKIGLIPPYRTRVGFTPALNLASFGLLGQQGFFDQFKTEFDLANDMFYIDDSRPNAVNPPANLPSTQY